MCTKIETYLFITENPCVPGSIPGGTTTKPCKYLTYKALCLHPLPQPSFLATFWPYFQNRHT